MMKIDERLLLFVASGPPGLARLGTMAQSSLHEATAPNARSRAVTNRFQS
jgi:hypothetical protein